MLFVFCCSFLDLELTVGKRFGSDRDWYKGCFFLDEKGELFISCDITVN
jgi:hypothetical protein